MSQPPDPFEFLKALWAPMGLPLATVFAPTLQVDEIDRRIAELRSVENWLNMNLGALRMTIQGLEMQRSALAAMQGAGADAPQAPGPAADAAGSADAGRRFAEAWWKMLQQAQSAHSPGSGQGQDPEKK